MYVKNNMASARKEFVLCHLVPKSDQKYSNPSNGARERQHLGRPRLHHPQWLLVLQADKESHLKLLKWQSGAPTGSKEIILKPLCATATHSVCQYGDDNNTSTILEINLTQKVPVRSVSVIVGGGGRRG